MMIFFNVIDRYGSFKLKKIIIALKQLQYK